MAQLHSSITDNPPFMPVGRQKGRMAAPILRRAVHIVAAAIMLHAAVPAAAQGDTARFTLGQCIDYALQAPAYAQPVAAGHIHC